MSLGDEWTETTAGSASKLNQVTITYGTGAYLSGLDKSKHKIVICTSTGSGFTVDHAYMANAAADEWLDLSDVDEHFHTDSTTGGAFGDMIANNFSVVDSGIIGLSNLTADSTGFYRQAVTGTGAWSTQTDGTTFERFMRASTGATNGSTLSTHTPINLSLDFTKTVKFAFKHQINTATSLALKSGIGMENLASADDNDRKVGAEICTTVNSNWFAASANGTTRSSSDTGEAMTTNKRSIIGIFDAANAEYNQYVENAVLFTKTSNLPTTAASNQPSRGSIFRYTVKNNTGSDRTFDFFGARIVYTEGDSTAWF